MRTGGKGDETLRRRGRGRERRTEREREGRSSAVFVKREEWGGGGKVEEESERIGENGKFSSHGW